ncbi:MAG: DUF58 domain-containing protein [Planctomycetota bacterium]
MGAERDPELIELLREVRRIDVQASRLVNGRITGEYTSVFRGTGLEFDGVREYEEGDDPRLVDWNVTARIGRPHVKKFIEERDLTVLFLLDLSASMEAGFGAWSVRQAAARVCACLAFAAIRNNDRVGLIPFHDEVDGYVPPSKGVRHVLRIVRDCLALPCPTGRTGRTRIGPALEYASRLHRRRAVLFVVSDFLTDDGPDAMRLCARRHDLVAVRMRAPELDGVRTSGLIRVVDPETGGETVLDAGSHRVREAWRARVAAWRERTTRELRRARVDLMDVPIPWEADPTAIARPILEFYRMREVRGAR